MNKKMNGKKLEERMILDYFSMVYEEFPKGRVKATESPDFIVYSGKKLKTGIEITRLTESKQENVKFTPVRVSHVENEILEMAANLYNRDEDPVPLAVSVALRDPQNIPEKDIPLIARGIATDVKNAVNSTGNKAVKNFSSEGEVASGYVDYIEGTCFPGLQNSLWLNAAAYHNRRLTREFLVKKIRSKEQKLPLYRNKNLNTIWLLMVTDSTQRTTPFNINNQIEAWNIESEFDRVFLFELVGGRIAEVTAQ